MYTVHIGGGWVRAGALIAVGLGTIAWFAVVGGVPRTWLPPDEVAGIVVIIVPVFIATFVRSKVSCARAAWYVLGLAAAMAADVLVFRHGSVPAMLVGIVPAVPCFLFARKQVRRAA